MVRIVALLCLGLLPLAACQRPLPPERILQADVEIEVEPSWRRAAIGEDVDHIDRIDAAWDEAHALARRAGQGRLMASEGALVDPDAALPIPAPTPGSYMCRLVRFGPEARRGAAVRVYRPFFCYVGVDGDAITIVKQTGSERPSGHLWEDPDRYRLIFLGSLARGADEVPIAYGDDRDRDMAGVFERVDDFRFRLVIPWPRAGATLDVFELVPAPPPNGG